MKGRQLITPCPWCGAAVPMSGIPSGGPARRAFSGADAVPWDCRPSSRRGAGSTSPKRSSGYHEGCGPIRHGAWQGSSGGSQRSGAACRNLRSSYLVRRSGWPSCGVGGEPRSEGGIETQSCLDSAETGRGLSVSGPREEGRSGPPIPSKNRGSFACADSRAGGRQDRRGLTGSLRGRGEQSLCPA